MKPSQPADVTCPLMLVFALMTIGTPHNGGARCRGIRVLARRFSERLFAKHRFDRAIDAVVAIDAIEVPLHHLRDGVLLFVVEAMQPRQS